MIPEYETLQIELKDKVAQVRINRPDKANAMNPVMWKEIGEAFSWLDGYPEARVVTLSGNGNHFCAGIDLAMFGDITSGRDSCQGRKREDLRRQILWMQDQLSAVEKCRKPVLAAIHGACIGGAIDLTSACDMRYCTRDASFSIKEIDIGMTADVGTLQRLPHLIGDGMMRELSYTGRSFDGEEAREIGFVNRVFADVETMNKEVLALATQIACKSPLSIRGTKEMIVYTRDHNVTDSLNYVATWNAGMILSNDLIEAQKAAMERRPPIFED